MIGFEHDPRDVAFESLRFSDSLRSQYNNALRHFVGYVKERKMDPAEAVVFVSPDGVAKDDMLRDFARYLHDSDGVTDSVFRNCLKWMQKNLEAQMTALDLPPPKAYVSRLPGMRELNHLQRPKQMAQRAIADAKDAELIRKLNASGGRCRRFAAPLAGARVSGGTLFFKVAAPFQRARTRRRRAVPGGAHAPARTPPPPNSRRTDAPSRRKPSNAQRRRERVGLALLEPDLQQVLHAQHVEVRF